MPENEKPDMNAVQAELMDMITKDESPSQISDRIKDMLFSKSAEKIDAFRPEVANSLFGDQEVEDEVEDEVDTETEAEADEEELPVAAETGAE
jgi:hypothetical protein|tara:strand:+ start:356 stop:634 length:279 start_codon:yes stop_codon:yes gene_type:complete